MISTRSRTAWAALLFGGALLAASACSSAVPTGPLGAGNTASQISGADTNVAAPADTTSILKMLKKDVVIGSTVDPKNGDTGPHAVSIVREDDVLKKGQLLVCNFADKAGTAGEGTTIELLDPKPGSKPATFAQSNNIKGCVGDAVGGNDSVYGAGFTSHHLEEFSAKGAPTKKYSGPPFAVPFSDFNNGLAPRMYKADYLWISDAKTGSIIHLSIDPYGIVKPLQVANGFAVNSKSGWSALGPSGLQYDSKADTLYIADGVDNTIVAFTHASDLLVKDEITVNPGGKTFTCKYPATTCGKLIYSGKDLDAPEAMTLLPNGNLIVANSNNNALVELTSAGKVLDTKVVDKSKTAAIFGLAATGTTDDDTTLFYTDTNTNELNELEP